MTVLEESCLGLPITARMEHLDDGITVLLTGGSRTHVGAVSVADPGKQTETITFPGHRDQAVSEPWAEAISVKSGVRAAVICGIHYDNATNQDIRRILEVMDRLLSDLLKTL